MRRILATLAVFLLTQLALATPEIVRDQIQQTIDRIEAAVVAGDAEAYLANIKPIYREFRFEQSEWARVMAEKTPEAFKWTILNVTPIDYGAQVDIEIRWTMPGGRERRIGRWPAVFVPGEGGWKYAGRSWETIAGPGYIINFPESQRARAERIAELMPEVIEHVHAELEEPYTGDITQRVKIFTTMLELQYSIYASYVDGLAGWNEPDESVKLLGSALRGNQAASILAHEYGHAVNFSMGDASRDTPWWVLEGVAEVCAEKYGGFGPRSDTIVRNWRNQGRLATWDKLASFENIEQQYYMHVYVQGVHMLKFITDSFGQTTRNNWVRTMAKGASLDEATREVLGMSFEELDQRWRESLEVEP